MQLLIVDPEQPYLRVSTGEEQPGRFSGMWTSAQQTFQMVRDNTSQIGTNLDKVPDRTREIGYILVEQADRVGSTFPDIVSPIKRAFSGMFD